jgi:mono/diheme cytochrome c family protein
VHSRSKPVSGTRALCWALGFAWIWGWATVPARAIESPAVAPRNPWGEWIEEDFPFFSSVLDVRRKGDPLLKDNLTPRALILNLGGGTWAGFDMELLRVTSIWEGRGVTPAALAPLTYHDPFNRTAGARAKLPVPVGSVWLENGLYPGWQPGPEISMLDPREPGPSKQEVGRGPLSDEAGRFRALRLAEGGVDLHYSLGDVAVVDRLRSASESGIRGVRRQVKVEAAPRELLLVVATRRPGTPARATLQADLDGTVRLEDTGPVTFVRIPPREYPVEFSVWLGPGDTLPPPATPAPALSRAPRWPQVLTTRAALSQAPDAFVIDDIPLPVENPWRRHLRLGDIQFFSDGRAAGVTIDGDVWLIDGLSGNLDQVRWRRFASGLHEPLSLAIRDEEIFVFDRNGLWRLRDTDGDGEADVHEMFCNLFAQTSDTREFPNSMKLAPDGAFIIAKGGQRGDTLAKDSGTVLRIAPDGRSVTTLGWGFRQPFLGVHPRTGLVTVTDQEGNYVPATPIYVLEKNEYHGFLAGFLPEKHPAPIAEPLVWLSHNFNAAAISQLWVTDTRMGPLNGALAHLGYNRPELFVVRMSERAARRQAAVMSLSRDWTFAPLNGAMNPADGQLYLTGFQIYASTAKRISGLARFRHTGAENPLPREVAALEPGVLLRFDVELDPRSAADPANYRVARWNYRRTPQYGSPHFRPDGEKGQEPLVPSSAYLSRDRRSVFVGIPDMRPGIMQMQVGWTLTSAKGAKLESEALLTPHELARFAPQADGFDDLVVDLTPRVVAGQAADSPVLTVADGRKLAEDYACRACHSTDGAKLVGPTWKGLPGSLRKFKGGSLALADDAYLRESILNSGAKMVEGFDEGMPSYTGILNDRQVDALILYIKSL